MVSVFEDSRAGEGWGMHNQMIQNNINQDRVLDHIVKAMGSHYLFCDGMIKLELTVMWRKYWMRVLLDLGRQAWNFLSFLQKLSLVFDPKMYANVST
jgi:hypothetical protein